MITLKSRDEVEKLRAAGRIVAEVMAKIGEAIAPGITTMDLERIATEHIEAKGAAPAFPTVPGYHHTLCVSVNEEIVHGIPGDRRLEEGDIASVDCGVLLEGFYGDHAVTFQFDLRDAGGTLIATSFRSVEPRSLRHLSVERLFGRSVAVPDPVGSIVVSGDGDFLAYLTVIDGTSQDPVFVMPK